MAVIRKRGESFQAIVRVTVDGRDFEQSRSFKTERLAKQWSDKLEAQIKLHGIPAKTLSTMSLGELILEHKQKLESIRAVRRQMTWMLDRLAVEFSGVKLNKLNAKVFSDYCLRRKTEDKAAPATILLDMSILSSVLAAAKPVHGVDVDGSAVSDAIAAMRRMGVVRRSESRSRRPTDVELALLQEEFDKRKQSASYFIPIGTIVDLAIALPRRLGELCSMTWEDYTGTTVTLRDTKHPVAPRTEVVPVPKRAREIIDSLPRVDARILPYDVSSVSAAFQRSCDKAGIMDLRFHDLRHEGITRLFEQGLGIQEVALISGHQSWTMLRRYTHITPEGVLAKLAEGAK